MGHRNTTTEETHNSNLLMPIGGTGSRGFPYRTNGGKQPVLGLLGPVVDAPFKQQDTVQRTFRKASQIMINSVKYTFVALAVAALASIATAQIATRPVTWVGTNNLNSFLTPLTAQQTTDFTAAGVNISSHGTVPLPASFVQGKPVPPVWFNPLGGSINVMFLGESAGWKNDLGYVLNPLSSNLSDSSVYNPLVVNIDSVTSGTPANGTLVNNTQATITYGAGQNLDVFLNGVGDGNSNGGTWFAFGTPNQFAGADNTIHTKFEYANIAGLSTLIVAFEDARFNQIDGDFSDVIVAFQGVTPPVPEPSTYGLIGAVALLGMVGIRRFTRKA